ncbi:MAG: ParA family protein [Cytophagales bacterium]|nr:ParA family protein [Cytophagales bacterium]
MTTVAIINQKGGTGKTTTTINLGSALAKIDKKVLLLDMDPQGNLSYSLGMNDFDYSMADVLLGEKKLMEILGEREGMSIAPSDIHMADVELSLGSADDQAEVLLNALKPLTDYDFVLIDCPPSLSILTLNALLASDNVIITMQMEVLSLQGLDMIMQTIQKVNKVFKKNIKVQGILPVMVDKRRKLIHEVREYIDENYDLKIFDSFIRNNVKASEAPSFGQSVIAYQPNSNSAKDYKGFANEFLKLNS